MKKYEVEYGYGEGRETRAAVEWMRAEVETQDGDSMELYAEVDTLDFFDEESRARWLAWAAERDRRQCVPEDEWDDTVEEVDYTDLYLTGNAENHAMAAAKALLIAQAKAAGVDPDTLDFPAWME